MGVVDSGRETANGVLYRRAMRTRSNSAQIASKTMANAIRTTVYGSAFCTHVNQPVGSWVGDDGSQSDRACVVELLKHDDHVIAGAINRGNGWTATGMVASDAIGTNRNDQGVRTHLGAFAMPIKVRVRGGPNHSRYTSAIRRALDGRESESSCDTDVFGMRDCRWKRLGSVHGELILFLWFVGRGIDICFDGGLAGRKCQDGEEKHQMKGAHGARIAQCVSLWPICCNRRYISGWT